MKKVLLVAAIAVFGFTQVQAQELSYGPKAGINVASLGGDTNFAGLDSRVSFHIGGFVEIPLMGKFSLQPELLYSSQGTSWNFAGANEDLKLDYINVPVMGKYNIVAGLSGELGPVFGFLVSAESGSEDVKDSFSTFDAAVAIGASYKLDMGVFFGLRYNAGLIDIWDDETVTVENKNNVFQISAGYAF